MQIPNISDNEFLNVITFNDLFSAVKTSLQEQNEGNMVPGLISPGSLAFSFSGLTVSVDAPLPFRISFGDGVLAKAMGTTDGQNTTDYSIDFSSFVPSSGSSTVYLLAETVQIQQDPFTIIGPPPGHPNYDPAFAPYLAYSTLDDSLNLFASTTAADNKTTFELGRVTLTAGQTSITSIDTSHQTYATSLLNPTGVASGTYTTPDLTIDPDGRILSAVENTNVALLNGNNSFTGNNAFTNPVGVGNATGLGDAVPLGQADSLFAALNGSSSENFATDALTSSGLITADGGLIVPSGQTEYINGTLSTTNGIVEIANATQANEPVSLGQFETKPQYFYTQSGSITADTANTQYTLLTFSITFPSFSKTGSFRILVEMNLEGTNAANENGQNFFFWVQDSNNNTTPAHASPWPINQGTLSGWGLAQTALSATLYSPGSTVSFSFITQTGGVSGVSYSISNSTLRVFVIEA